MKRIIKANTVLFFICLFLVFCIGIVTNKSVVFALDEQNLNYTFTQDDFTFIPNENVDSRVYSNAEFGSKIRVSMTSVQYENIISIKYTLVKISSGNIVTHNDKDIYIDGKVVTSDNVVKNGTDTIYKSGFKEYEKPNVTRHGYIDITAHEWCAIVLVVKYNDAGKEAYNHSSHVYNVTNIDNSKPTAYYSSWSYNEGFYTFRVTVNGNQLQAKRTENSGISKVEFIKVTGAGATEQTTILDTIDNITKTPYFYDLKVDANEKAFFYARVSDWVGNKNYDDKIKGNLIAAFGSYDASFESAVNNALHELERAKDVFSPHILKNLTDEFATYGIRVQEFQEAQDKTNAAAKVEIQKNVIYNLLKEYANVRTLAENGVRDFNLKIINSEYLNGVSIGNVNKAYTTLLYGEVANFTIALADFDLRLFDKTKEIEASGLKNAKRVLSLTLETNNSQKGDVDITFTSPLDIRIPIANYKAVSAVVKLIDENGNERLEKLDITEYRSYFMVHMPYSKGVVSVVFGEKIISPYYWFFTLLVIPIAIGLFFLFRHTKKKKLEKMEQLAKERQENKQKYVAKNKSKKGKKKKK